MQSSSSGGERPAPYCVGLVASAGGLDALARVLAPLPKEFPAAIVVVLHLQPDRLSLLAPILSNQTRLKVRQAKGGETLTAGKVLVAPPDRHIEVCANGTVRLTQSPKENFTRPSGDPLFFSLAEHYKDHAVVGVLTGFDGDGAQGLLAVKRAGGATLVQDEATSRQFSMPRAAIETGAVDQVLNVDEIGAELQKLVSA